MTPHHDLGGVEIVVHEKNDGSHFVTISTFAYGQDEDGNSESVGATINLFAPRVTVTRAPYIGADRSETTQLFPKTEVAVDLSDDPPLDECASSGFESDLPAFIREA